MPERGILKRSHRMLSALAGAVLSIAFGQPAQAADEIQV